MHQDRYVPADNNGGWGYAVGVLLLVAALIIAVTIIHKRTYKPFTDVTARVHGEPGIAGVAR